MWVVPCLAILVDVPVEVTVLVLVLSALLALLALVDVSVSQTLLLIAFLLLMLLKAMSNRTELVGMDLTVLPALALEAILLVAVLAAPLSLRLPPSLSTFAFLYCWPRRLLRRLCLWRFSCYWW